MENQWFRDILQFHMHAEQTVGNRPKVPDEETKALRIRLIKEEIDETIEALETDNLIEVADGIADSIVVLIGTAIAYGIDLEDVWNEVHYSNMSKFKNGVIKDEGGKVLKPDGWSAPDIPGILDSQLPLKDSYTEANSKLPFPPLD